MSFYLLPLAFSFHFNFIELNPTDLIDLIQHFLIWSNLIIW